jgi:hypothetical protein
VYVYVSVCVLAGWDAGGVSVHLAENLSASLSNYLVDIVSIFLYSLFNTPIVACHFRSVDHVASTAVTELEESLTLHGNNSSLLQDNTEAITEYVVE